VRFHCGYCGKEGHKDEFCFKRKREERMAKDWANKDRYNTSHGVPKPRMPLPRGKTVVRSVPAWGDASSRSRGAVLERAVRPAWLGGQTGPAQRGAVRPVWLGGSTAPPRFLGGVVFEVVSREVSVLEIVVLVVVLESQQVVSLLGILRLEFTTGMGGVVALRRRGGTVHGSSFMALVLLQEARGDFLGVVTEVVFVVVVLVGKIVLCVLTPLLSKWLGTGFTHSVLTPVLVFELQVGGLKNIWLIDSGCSMHMTGDRGWFPSTSLLGTMGVGVCFQKVRLK
jgi:hypothetical protein